MGKKNKKSGKKIQHTRTDYGKPAVYSISKPKNGELHAMFWLPVAPVMPRFVFPQSRIINSSASKQSIENLLSFWLQHNQSLLPGVNCYNYPDVDSIDVSDFLDLSHDAILNILDESDSTILWSPFDVFDIILNPHTRIRVTRGEFEESRITYGAVVYARIILNGEESWIPVLSAGYCYIWGIRNGDKADSANQIASVSSLSREYRVEFDAIDKAYSRDSYSFVLMGCMGVRLGLDCLKYLNTNKRFVLEDYNNALNELDNIFSIITKQPSEEEIHAAADAASYKLLTSAFTGQRTASPEHLASKAAYNLVAKNQVDTINVKELGGFIISTILRANQYLKQGSISKAVSHTNNPSGNVIAVAGDPVAPSRKTRILGKRIKISSVKKPQAPSRERIITYHTGEWERREHVRHLKNGKTIMVRAASCKRKCVEIANTATPVKTLNTLVLKNGE